MWLPLEGQIAGQIFIYYVNSSGMQNANTVRQITKKFNKNASYIMSKGLESVIFFIFLYWKQ